MSKNAKAILDLIDANPEEKVLYRALWVVLGSLQQKALKEIAAAGRIGVTELAQAAGIEQATLSSELVKLRRLGLVEDEREGKRVFYSVALGRVNILKAIA